MNLLLDDLPEDVSIDGKTYFIDTDFRTFIIFELVMNDASLDSKSKVWEAINLCYTMETPTNIEEALNQLLIFYNCGEAPRKSTSSKLNGTVVLKPQQIYDYREDAPYIFGAFLSQYNIDLNDIGYLHWWKFQALFRSLNSSNKIVEIMGYRAADLNKIEIKSERDRIARLKQIYALKDNLSFEDKVARAGAAFGGGF